MLTFPEEQQLADTLEVYVAKPAYVLADSGAASWLGGRLMGSIWSIKVNELAAMLIDVGLNGHEKRILLQEDLAQGSRSILARMK